jgi:hypothetical protein
MNRSQKVLTTISLVVFLATVLLAPWEVVTTDEEGHVGLTLTKYSPVCFAPDASPYLTMNGGVEARLRWEALLCTWLALSIAYAGAFFLLRPSPAVTPPPSPPTFDQLSPDPQAVEQPTSDELGPDPQAVEQAPLDEAPPDQEQAAH